MKSRHAVAWPAPHALLFTSVLLCHGHQQQRQLLLVPLLLLLTLSAIAP
jgi:hypothetical protein